MVRLLVRYFSSLIAYLLIRAAERWCGGDSGSRTTRVEEMGAVPCLPSPARVRRTLAFGLVVSLYADYVLCMTEEGRLQVRAGDGRKFWRSTSRMYKVDKEKPIYPSIDRGDDTHQLDGGDRLPRLDMSFPV